MNEFSEYALLKGVILPWRYYHYWIAK